MQLSSTSVELMEKVVGAPLRCVSERCVGQVEALHLLDLATCIRMDVFGSTQEGRPQRSIVNMWLNAKNYVVVDKIVIMHLCHTQIV